MPAAKKLLIEAGYSDGKFKSPGPLEWGNLPIWVGVVQVVQSFYKEAGVDFDLLAIDGQAYVEKWFQRSFTDMTLNHGTFGGLNPYTAAAQKFGPDSPYNTAHINEPVANKILQDIKITTDPVKIKGFIQTLWDLDTTNMYNVWFGAETLPVITTAQVRNYLTRSGTSGTLLRSLPWLADAPRTAP